MITEKDLIEAIAECQGQKNPNASTCIKLAAFYTIKNELYPSKKDPADIFTGYSYASPENSQIIDYAGESDVARIIDGKPLAEVLAVFEELMESLSIVEPRLYAAVLRKLRGEP